MHSATFLRDLAVVMIVAGLVTIIFHRLKQPVVLGYILAGLIIGPHTPPFPLIHDETAINTLADLGVVLLMFSLGLEFSLRKLQQVGGTAFIAALLEILLMVWLGYELGLFFGWSRMDSLFLGAMLSISSTTIIVKALGDLGRTREHFAQIIFGILIIEDVLAIVMIALLSGIAMTGTLSAETVGVTIGKLGIFLVAALVGGLIAVPRLLGYVAKFKSNEMLLITVLGLCFGFSLLAVKLGYSVALGAFMIGAVIAEAREIGRIEILTAPIRDMFSAIFFVAIGLLIDPRLLLEHWLPIVIITLLVVGGKIVTCTFGAFVGGNDSRTSLRVGMGLAQIGEFSFIIASLGLSLNVTSKFLYPVAVAVSVITTLLTPYLIRSADGMVSWFERVTPASLANPLKVYTRWVGRLGQASASTETALVRLWMGQIFLNAVLITAVLVVAIYVSQHPPQWLPHLGWSKGTLDAALWLAAVVLSLPMFIASFRRLQDVGVLIAETRVTAEAAGEHAAAIRTVVAQVIPIAGTVILGLYVLALSSTLLPPLNVLIVLLLIVGLLTWLLRGSFIKIYSKAELALQETMSEPPQRHGRETGTLPSMLREADLETVALKAGSPAERKLIRELELRTRTGASIVGIERGTASLVNPGPDEELQAGDRVLLLGTPAQLEAARSALTGIADAH